MKKLLVEYAKIFGYTFTGLIFGLAFFLLFINFYHYKEINTTVDLSEKLNTEQETVNTKLEQIKNNLNNYDQYSYNGSENVFDLNNMKIRMNSCVTIFESEEAQNYFNKTTYSLKDVYDFAMFYQNQIYNNCVILQLNAFGADDGVFDMSSLNEIRPFVADTISTLNIPIEYITKNIENADMYYFSSDNNKTTVFNLSQMSFNKTMQSYQATLDLLVDLSAWYSNLVMGG